MAKNGMVGRSFRIPTYNGPSPKSESVIDFPILDGGLNIYDLDNRLKTNESPEMKNLLWRDGALGCRQGQAWLMENGPGEGFCCYERLFWGHIFSHIGDRICCTDPSKPEYVELYSGLQESRGVFFRYGEKLYYKNRGSYVQISYNPEGRTVAEKFTASDVTAYVPVTYINMNPTTHAGTSYQPENRLSPSKTIWYDAEAGVDLYYLPEQDIEGVSDISVDGKQLTENTDYTVDRAAGTVKFTTAPPVGEPFYPNTVKLTYTKTNADLRRSIMDCCYAIAFGGNQNVCVVMGGCPAQPNAYFWNGNHIAMDAGYFPVEQYNLAGDTEDEITAFGRQQNMLVIFKRKSIGRATMDTTTTDSERLVLQMPYTAINAEIGCDLPWTVQLIGNNLVFCNTERGVHMVLDSSSAYENNIAVISKKVNGGTRRSGLLDAVRLSTERSVCSFDDNARYWLVANGKAYVWDYELSSYKDPRWFYYTNINAVGFAASTERSYHINRAGQMTILADRLYSDYGGPIEKVFQFGTQMMGTHNTLKDVRSVLFAVRSSTDTEIKIRYETDYESRYDLSPIHAYTWKLSPRNLSYRYLGAPRFAHIERREPKCRNIKHFSMRLENNVAGQDLSVVSAQVFYNFQGRYR